MKIGRHEENPVAISDAAQARHRAIVAQGAPTYFVGGPGAFSSIIYTAVKVFLGGGLKFRDENAQELPD